MTASLVSGRADLVSVVEAAYAAEPDARAWARGFVARVAAIGAAPAVGLSVVAHEDDYSRPHAILDSGSDATLERVNATMVELIPSVPPNLFRVAYYPGLPMSTHSELEERLSPTEVEHLRGYRAALGAVDVWGCFSYPAPGIAAVLYGAIDRTYRASPADRRLFGWVAAHLDTGLRLRLRPQAAVAGVLSSTGELLDSVESPSRERRERLAARVSAIESSRTRARRREPDALARWAALIDGRYSVVPRDDRDGKRYYLLVVNAPPAQETARFSVREVDVVRLAARGLSGKGIAYSLGLSEAAVSTALRSAANRLGLRSPVALVDVASSMFGRLPAGAPLTEAEQAVLELLRRGLSNAEIAHLRRRSLRTVVNQVSSILRKTRSPSRRAAASLAKPDGGQAK